LLARWQPGGKRSGREYIVRHPTRHGRAAGSFKIAMSGSRAGVWSDFASGDAGADAISLAAYLFGFSQGEAAKKIPDMLGVPHV
jgi:hypothetical protein